MSNKLNALLLAASMAGPTACVQPEAPLEQEGAGEVFALRESFNTGCVAHIRDGADDDQLQGAARTRKIKLNEVPGCEDASRWICAQDTWEERNPALLMDTVIKCPDREGPEYWELVGDTVDDARFVSRWMDPSSY